MQQWLAESPITDIPAKYVVFQPLAQVSEGDEPKVVVMLANPDQMSALVVLARLRAGRGENTIIPFGLDARLSGSSPTARRRRSNRGR